MQPDAHSHAVKVELSYEGKYYTAAKAAAVLATPFTAAADMITLPIQIPVFIHGLSSIRY